MDACVVVLGDIGRSPRMQYHSLSLAKIGYNVNIIAYKGSKPIIELEKNYKVRQNLMNEVPAFSKYTGKYLSYVLKVFWQSFVLIYTLFSQVSFRKTKFILVQNPPSIPTLPVLWFYCLLTRINLIIDWHNYGYTILGLSLGEKHLLVKLCKWVEHFFGFRAKYHFSVTEALKHDLYKTSKIKATVLYDKPPLRFQPLDWDSKHHLLQKLKVTYKEFRDIKNKDCTRLTDFDPIENKVTEKKNRPVFLVSSTSWTEDEDFSVLLTALDNYEKICSKNTNLPQIVCIITGKGPLKEYFANIIQNKIWRYVEIVLPWLEAEDYPKLLGTCDLGISLHKSSSNLDLPMKIVDMFGCGLPVCSINYPCITELVKHEKNGLLFSDSNELTRNLCQLLKNFPENKVKLNQFKEYIVKNFLNLRWEDNWYNLALPVINQN